MNRATERTCFDVHGVRLELRGDPEARAGLAVHFGAFAAPIPRGAPDVVVELRREAPSLPLPPGHPSDQVVDRGVVYNVGSTTVVDHHGHAVTVFDFARDEGRIVALETADLVELGYLAASSRLGVHLERRGLTRVHGVGIELDGRAALLLAPSGGGKSTIARALRRHTRVRVLGDDLVLLDARGRMLPFPTPLGLTRPEQAAGLGDPIAFPRRLHPPKWVLPVSADPARDAREPVQLAWVVLLTRAHGDSVRMTPASPAAIGAALFRDAVIGLGLPQVLELIARRGARDLGEQLPTAIRRSRAVTAVLARARGARLALGSPEVGAARLETLLASEDGRDALRVFDPSNP